LQKQVKALTQRKKVNFLLHLANSAFFIILGILGLGFLIGFHEFGHFLFCKIFRIKTPSFSIGMGPKIFSKKIGDTVFSLSAIPLGGYVEIAGLEEVAQGEQKESKRSDDLSFNQKPYYQKLLVLTGGIVFNLIFAYIAFIGLYMTGIPKVAFLFPEEQPVIVKKPSMEAELAGLQAGDKIKKLIYTDCDNLKTEEINNFPEFQTILQNLKNKDVTLLVDRKNEQKDIKINVSNEGTIGFEPDFSDIKIAPSQSFFKSIKSGIHAANLTIVKTFSAFKSLFSGKNLKGLGGPLLIISETINSAKKGFKVFLVLLALISVNLAVLNLIPLPILDGGQILFTTIETVIRRQLSDKVKNAIQIACWILIVGLMLLLTVWDIRRIFF
jgi:regulator of sigma E protease